MEKIKKFVFNVIRYFFWSDYDPNEDFSCGFCGKAVYHRYLFCSRECQEKFEAECLYYERKP